VRVSDTLKGTGNLQDSTVQNETGGTHVDTWRGVQGQGAGQIGRTASGSGRMTAGGWATNLTEMVPAAIEGEVEVTLNFGPPLAGGCCNANGKWAGLLYLSDGISAGGPFQNALAWRFQCGGPYGGQVALANTWGSGPQVAGGVLGMACDSTDHLFRAEWKLVGSTITHKLFKENVEVYSGTTTTPTFSASAGYYVGITMYDDNTHASSGMVMKDFSARVGPNVGDVPLPEYRCGRTLRNVGGGQWFVDLEAFNVNPVNTGGVGGGDFVGYADSGYLWNVSWSEFDVGANIDSQQTGVPSRNTIALPALSTMPQGGWTATFYVTRETDVGRGGSYADLGPGAARNIDEDETGAGEEVKPWWVHPTVWALWTSLPASWRDGSRLTPGGIVYDQTALYDGDHFLPPWVLRFDTMTGGGDFDPATAAPWQSVTATCTVTIDPLNPGDDWTSGTTAPPPGSGTGTTTTTVPGSTTTTRPAGTEGTQGEDGSRNDCSAGFLGRLPVIGGFFDLTARLVCALKQLLVELFVPDDFGQLVSLDEFGSKFPVSWVGEGVSGVNTLRSSIQTGVGGSACGPVMNVPAPIGMTVRLPSPPACGGSGSSVTAGYSEAYDVFGYRSAIRATLTAMLYLGLVWRMIRLVPWGGGKDDGGPTF
jgi:hypothetical protein